MKKKLGLEELQSLIRNKNVRELRYVFDEYNIVDLAELVNDLEVCDIIFIFKVVFKDITGELFSYLDSDVVENMVKTLSSNEIRPILNNLYADDIRDFLQELPEDLVRKVLSNVTKQQKDVINQLLSYEEDTAGSIMSLYYLTLDANDTVGVAMQKIKKYGRMVETIGKCFVLNDQEVLIGTVALRSILFAREDVLINDIMNTDFVTVKTGDDVEDVAKVIQKYDITSVGVTDEHGHMLGIITVDDVVDVIQDEATEDIQKMAAITPIDQPYMESSAAKIAASCLIWLVLLMVSYTLSSIIITNNNHLLVAIPSLVTFIPMLMDTAGNAGGQASAMVIRGISVDNLSMKDFFEVFFKELKISLACGLILFVINTLRIVLFVSNVGWDIAVVVSASVYLVVILAKIVGGTFPLLAYALKLDPATMAAPLITTACDSLSLLAYFALAGFWLSM